MNARYRAAPFIKNADSQLGVIKLPIGYPSIFLNPSPNTSPALVTIMKALGSTRLTIRLIL